MYETTMAEHTYRGATTTRRHDEVETKDDNVASARELMRQLIVHDAQRQTQLSETLHLPIGDLKALELLVEFDGLPTGHIARLLGISSGGTTALINRLEASGLVTRDRHPLDRRMIVIRAQRDALPSLETSRVNMLKEVFSDHAISADPQLQAQLSQAMKSISQHLHKQSREWLGSDLHDL